MKGAIASVEIYAHREGEPVRRLTFVVSDPRAEDGSAQWTCRVALADRHRPQTLTGADSVEVLGKAIDRGREWIVELESEGYAMFRDRAGEVPYVPYLEPGKAEAGKSPEIG